MGKAFHIILLLTLASFTLPKTVVACGTPPAKTEKTSKKESNCCDKEKPSGSEEKDCCKEKTSQHNEKDDDCGGKCGDSSCHCVNFCYGFALPSLTETGNLNFTFETNKSKIYYNNHYVSSGFLSIWAPPNIG